MNVREEVKLMLLKKKITLTKLAEQMTELTGISYSQSKLSHKLLKETLKYSEMKLICKILGYEICIDLGDINIR
ncbi:MAG: LLM class flavin-dependent oxidoreductase [Heliobacteriaceae bacterium]|nr:LLM class flavin-dependent oxidoreductase [Heliobacteriaceae bacterium]